MFVGRAVPWRYQQRAAGHRYFPFWQMAISGSVIVIAVLLNERGNKRKGRLILRDAALARQKQAVKS
jgi:hypothetical protein